MGEMRMLGTKLGLEAAIPKEVQEFFDLDITGGDSKIMWNPRDSDELDAAKSNFDSLKAKRFVAYKVDDRGEKGEQIEEFDPEAGKIILVPPMAGGSA